MVIQVLHRASGPPTSAFIHFFVNDSIGGGVYIDDISLVVPTTDIEPADQIPEVYALKQNYPNPFNPSTIISWQLPVASYVELKVYDILGNEVVTLVNENKEAGNYEVMFDASILASGTYIYRLEAGNYVSIKKMSLIK